MSSETEIRTRDATEYAGGLETTSTAQTTTPIGPSAPARLLRLPDGSKWRIGSPLSQTRYREYGPPFEAIRAFTCKCMDDPMGDAKGKDAVVKIRYQVSGTTEQVAALDKRIAVVAATADMFPDCEEIRLQLNEARELRYQATHPTTKASVDCQREIAALSRLKFCGHAPLLVAHSTVTVPPGFDNNGWGMVGGFFTYIVTTRLGGHIMTPRLWLKLRNNTKRMIREAFKKALITVWQTSIFSTDNRMENLVFNPTDRRCYIVNFERFQLLDIDKNGLPEWTDNYYVAWGLGD